MVHLTTHGICVGNRSVLINYRGLQTYWTCKGEVESSLLNLVAASMSWVTGSILKDWPDWYHLMKSSTFNTALLE
jgi:hypothetical protein